MFMNLPAGELLDTNNSNATITNAGTDPAGSPAVTQDRFGRSMQYLRVSVTDRCNLRCVYCMPAQGVPSKPHDAILRLEEIGRVVQAAAGVGFRAVRLTGGEPLVRKGIVDLVRMIASTPGIEDVALTTNATLLATYAQALAAAGLKRVNISLDTLQPERFHQITRRGNLDAVWQGIEAAERAGFDPLKINMVVVRGFNDDEIVDLARLTLDHPWHIRFIEVMPLSGISDWGPGLPGAAERLVPVAEIQQRLEVLGPLAPDSGPGGRGPARYVRLPGARGTLGFISPMSEHFCRYCNRMRLTADGHLRACLFSETGVDVRPALAAGASGEELQALIREAAGLKQEHYAFDAGAISGSAMSTIGG